MSDLEIIKQVIYKVKGRSFESFQIFLAWEKLINQYIQNGMSPVEALAADIMRVRNEADRADTYEEHLKKIGEYKELREKWEKYCGKKTIEIQMNKGAI